MEAAITVPMGFATNSMNLPALVEKVLVNCSLLMVHRSHVFMILPVYHPFISTLSFCKQIYFNQVNNTPKKNNEPQNFELKA